ncbi:MAG: type II toxin-antitoxin system RelE/ParE family toxin [Patescibacteria group bacterium]|nr:type II toxin-antitoxin system RelE/ParE family toxin [Patescibacteria group bacterium]
MERSAERDIKGLAIDKFNVIISHLKNLSKNPRPVGCRKIKGSKSDWCIRIGQFRIIFEIDDKEKTVKVMRIRHRKEAYR